MSLRREWESLDSAEIARRGRETDFCASTSLQSAPAVYDPILTPLFASYFASFGITGSFFGAGLANTLGSLTTALVTTAASIGIQMALAPKPPKPEDGKAPIMQAIPPRHWVVGRRRISGAYMMWEAKGRYLYSVQALAGHRITNIVTLYLHDDIVTRDANDDVIAFSDGRYAKQTVHIEHRLGLDPETAYDFLVADLAADDVWTNDHRGDGQASIAMRCTSPKAAFTQTVFPYGAPRLSAVVDGARVWDYRDEDQDPDDPSTWQFSRNAALVMCWHQCFNEFGHRRDYRKAILPLLDQWIEEANVCDEDMSTADGGTRKRFTTGGYDTTEHDPKIGTNAIMSACDGWLGEMPNGALLFIVGKFRETLVGELTDADVAGYQLQHDVLPEDECNRLIPKFTYPDTDYTTCDTDFFEDTAKQLAIGRPLAQEADYTWCDDWRQARFLGRRDWLRLQEPKRGELNVFLCGGNAIFKRWIRMSTPLGVPSMHGMLIENRGANLALLKGGFTLKFVKSPADIEGWNPTTDEGQKPPVPAKPNAADIVSPNITSVVAKATSGSVYLRIVIEDPEDDSLSLSVRYRIVDVGGGVPGDWVEKTYASAEPSSGSITVSTDIVPADQDLEVYAAFVSSKAKYSNWAPVGGYLVRSTSDPVAPGLVTGVSVSTGVGMANFAWTSPNSENYAGAKIYWNTVNSFGSASFLGPIEYGSPKRADSATRSLTAGVRYGWITSVNKSGVESAPVATGAFVVG